MDNQTIGTISVDNEVISDYSEEKWDKFRNENVGFIFQSFNLLEELSAEENLKLPLNIIDMSEEQRNTEVKKVLEYVKLEKYKNRKINELSAGQKQRVAIGRAVIKHPKILLADELTGNLVTKNSERIFNLLENISNYCLVIVVTHDILSAYKYADRIVEMSDGKIIKDFYNKELKTISKNEYAIELTNNKTNVKKTYSNINDFDIKQVILDCSDNTNFVNVSIEIKGKHMHKPENRNIKWGKLGETCRLSFCKLLSFSLPNLKNRKLRLSMTVIMICFTSLFCILFSQIKYNDYTYSLSQSIKNTSNIVVYKNITSDDEKTHSFDMDGLYTGKEIYDELRGIAKDNNVIGVDSDISVEYENSRGFSNTSVIYYEKNKNEKLDKLPVDGRLPLKDNEIVLDKKVAKEIDFSGEDIEKSILLDDKKFKVVGILKENISDGLNISILSKSSYDKFYDKTVLCAEALDISDSSSVSNFVGAVSDICSTKLISKNMLLAGRMPKNNSEVLFSKSMVKSLDKDLSVIGLKCMLPNLYAEKYSGLYQYRINLYDHLGSMVTVVGVYDDDLIDSDNLCAKIVVNNEAFNSILKYYYDYLNYNQYMLLLDNDNLYDYVEKLSKNDYVIDYNTCSIIYLCKNFCNEMSFEIFAIILISVFVTLIMLISYISYNVSDHSKKIGIFRSIGISRSDISLLFLIETLIICLFSVILADICGYFSIKFINNILGDSVIFNFNVLVLVIVSVIIILISVLATLIPLYRLVNQKSVNLLNKTVYL